MNNYLKYTILVIGSFVVAYIIVKILRRLINLLIEKNSELIKVNPTNFIFLRNAVGPIVFSIALMWVFFNIPYLNSLGKALFAGAGVLAAIIGFATQKAFSNIISGIFILLFKPFRIGDIIEIPSGRKGVVEEITLRHIVMKDFEYKRILIPNNLINEKVIVNCSLTDEKIRKHIEVNIGYDSDIDEAMEILRVIVHDHPLSIDNRTDEEVEAGAPVEEIKVIALNDSSIRLRAYVWVRNNIDAFNLTCDTLYQVTKAYKKAGIEIPYPYQNVVNKSV